MEEEIAMLIRIMIVKKHSGCFIVQPHTLAGSGDTVRFSAINIDAKTKVIINFPGGSPFVEEENLFILRGNESRERTINKDAPYGTYPFSAFCTEYNTFAEGGSSGELIVGP